LNPEVQAVQYQQGELQGYEIREYLLEKYGRKCVYCGANNVPLEIDHIHPKSKGGSDRVSNLTIACHACNQAKGNLDIKDFLKEKQNLLTLIQAKAKVPLKDAAVVNSTRDAIVKCASSLCKDVKCWTGGRTKFNRCQQNLEKSHSIDASCIGKSGSNIKIKTDQPLIVSCKGHGNRQARRVNSSGFPAVVKAKQVFNHATAGDLVRVTLEKDRKNVKKGIYTARVKTPTPRGVEVIINSFRIAISSLKNVVFIQRCDGYVYEF